MAHNKGSIIVNMYGYLNMYFNLYPFLNLAYKNDPKMNSINKIYPP